MLLAIAMAALLAAPSPVAQNAAAHTLAAGTRPARILLLADASTPSLEQHSVKQRLISALLADANVSLLTPDPLPFALRRADALRKSAHAALGEGRRALETLEPFVAAHKAAFATTRLERAAMLSGDFGQLPESLGVLAAALMHLDAPSRASQVLMRLLTLAPDWQPDPGHYSPAMVAQIERARRRLGRLGTYEVAIDAGDERAALFVDGKFIDFGAAKIALRKGVPHFVWAQPDTGFAHGVRLDAAQGGQTPALSLLLPKAQAHPHSAQTRFDSLIAASLNPKGYVNAHSALIEGMRVDEVWVLGYEAGMVRLVAFELRSGRRHQVATPALITHLADVRSAVDTLLSRHSKEQSLAERR